MQVMISGQNLQSSANSLVTLRPERLAKSPHLFLTTPVGKILTGTPSNSSYGYLEIRETGKTF